MVRTRRAKARRFASEEYSEYSDFGRAHLFAKHVMTYTQLHTAMKAAVTEAVKKVATRGETLNLRRAWAVEASSTFDGFRAACGSSGKAAVSAASAILEWRGANAVKASAAATEIDHAITAINAFIVAVGGKAVEFDVLTSYVPFLPIDENLSLFPRFGNLPLAAFDDYLNGRVPKPPEKRTSPERYCS